MASHKKMIGFVSAAVITAAAALYYGFSKDSPSLELIDHPAIEQTNSYARRLRRALDEQDQETRFAVVREVVDDYVCQLPGKVTIELDGSVQHGIGSPGTLVLRYQEPDLSTPLKSLCTLIAPAGDSRLQDNFAASAGRALKLQFFMGLSEEVSLTYNTTFTCDHGEEKQ